MSYRFHEAFEGFNDAVSQMRSYMPRDFPPSLPIYGVAYQDMISLMPHLYSGYEGAGAFTQHNLSDRLKPLLECAGVWQGPGFAVMYNRTYLNGLTPAQRMGIVLHESAHFVELSIIHSVLGMADQVTTIMANGMWKDVQQNLGGYHHGPLFARAASHLYYRARAQGCRTESKDVVSGSGAYESLHQQSPSTLFEECANLAHFPIAIALYGNPPPKQFGDLWQCPSWIGGNCALSTVVQFLHYPGRQW